MRRRTASKGGHGGVSEPICLIGAEDALAELAPEPYDSEALLQGYLTSYPRLLSSVGSPAGAKRGFLLVGQEAALADSDNAAGRWSVDHLFVDGDAVPTIVEIKRSTDTRIRREVVGQMLDYAANAVLYWPVEQLRSTFELTATQAGMDPAATLADVIGLDRDQNAFWQQVQTNLQAGRIRLVFVADEIPRELRRIVEFLNGQMSPAEALAVEVRQYVSGSTRALVPRLIGQTAGAERAKGTAGPRPARQWDEASLLADMQERGLQREAAVVANLMDWARPRFNRMVFGKGQRWARCRRRRIAAGALFPQRPRGRMGRSRSTSSTCSRYRHLTRSRSVTNSLIALTPSQG
jgi:hypothetical protein